MLIEMPKQFSKYLGHLCNKFVVDDFQKSPKLVTVITQVELCRVKISYSTLKTHWHLCKSRSTRTKYKVIFSFLMDQNTFNLDDIMTSSSMKKISDQDSFWIHESRNQSQNKFHSIVLELFR